MDIIESFSKNDGKYKFISLAADCSVHKYFYSILKDSKPIDKILMKINTSQNIFEEFFDEDHIDNSQYDYFKNVLCLFNSNIAYDNDLGIIVMECLGKITLADVFEQQPPNIDELYRRELDLLVKMQDIKIPPDNIINKRTFGKLAVAKELQKYLDGQLLFSSEDKKYLSYHFCELINDAITNEDRCLCHRDFQSKNIMIKNNELHIIDVQDMCIGPCTQDLACALYESKIILSEDRRNSLMKYFYDQKGLLTDYDEFCHQVRILGLFRILKCIGTHYNYYSKNNQLTSLKRIQDNMIILNNMKNYFPGIVNTINKYKFRAVILAAGRGSRMGGSIPKALCEINGRPMLYMVLDKITKLVPDKIIVVVGYKKDLIISALKNYPFNKIKIVEQKELLGTGHAVMQAVPLLSNSKHCLINFADNPNIKIESLIGLIQCHVKENNDITIGTYHGTMSATKSGRVIRENSIIQKISEDADSATPSDEFAGGLQIYKTKVLIDNLKTINNNNKQSEYYLPDAIRYPSKIGNIFIDLSEMINVNTPREIEFLEKN